MEVSADARIKIKKEAGSYSLTCDKCTSQDQGSYTVQLSNALGQVSAWCALSVDCELNFNFYRSTFDDKELQFRPLIPPAKPKILSDNLAVKE